MSDIEEQSTLLFVCVGGGKKGVRTCTRDLHKKESEEFSPTG